MCSVLLYGVWEIWGEPPLCETSAKANAAPWATSSSLASESDFWPLLCGDTLISASSLLSEYETGKRGVLFPFAQGSLPNARFEFRNTGI